MKTVSELKNEFSALKQKKISRAEKLPIARAIRGGVGEIEQAAMRDFSFPLAEIRKAKDFIAEIDAYLK